MKSFSALSDFPTDNSSKTNLKYDIITSKIMNGMRNHQRSMSASSSSVDAVFYIIGAVLQLALSAVVMLGLVLYWIWKKL